MFMCAYVDFYVRLLDVIARYLQWNLLVKFISAYKLSTFQWNTYYCGVVRFSTTSFFLCMFIYIYIYDQWGQVIFVAAEILFLPKLAGKRTHLLIT